MTVVLRLILNIICGLLSLVADGQAVVLTLLSRAGRTVPLSRTYASRNQTQHDLEENVLQISISREKNEAVIGLSDGGLGAWQRSGCVAALTAPRLPTCHST